MSKNLLETMHEEMDRCRELKKEYDLIPTGFFGSATIVATIKQAEKAIEEGDPIKMLVALEELKKIEG